MSKGVARVDAQREPYASWWDDHNLSELEKPGRLWVALGDSAVQGIGASSPSAGWVPTVISLLNSTDPPWRVINLAMTGARMRHVAHEQLGVLAAHRLQPDLVTCMIGTNDFIAGATAATIRADAVSLVGALPRGTLLGRIGGPGGHKRNHAIRSVFGHAADEGNVTLFQPYDWPRGERSLAADRFHPNDVGYDYIAQNAWKAIQAELGL